MLEQTKVTDPLTDREIIDPRGPLGDELKEEFPLLANNPDLVYLDSAATSQKPEAVLRAVDSYYRNDNANVHRSIYALAERSTLALENSRRTVELYLGASSPREVIFTRGTTESLNLVAWSLSELLVGEGDIILVSTLEHHANFVPWQQAAERKGGELLLIPALEDGTLDMGFFDVLEKDGRAERVKVAATAHISNAFGTIHQVRAISKWCRDRNIPLVLDAAQSLPHLPIDVTATGADFLAFSGHKVYGPMGSGVLWGREEWLEKMPPWQTGGEMISMVKPEKSTWNELPYKFEAGTPDVAAAVGLAAALDWMTHTGVERLEAREHGLGLYAFERLKSLEGLTLYGPDDPFRRRGVFSFNLEGIHSHDVAQYLDRTGVAVRSGHHCAQPAMRLLGIPSTARASLAPYNTRDDIDRLVDGILGVQEYFQMMQQGMEALDDLYMEIILDHYKSPRNKADLSHISDDQIHENPSCGDTVKLDMTLGNDGRITEVRFDGHGCAISTASASLMTERLPGLTPVEAREFINLFLKVLRGDEPAQRLEDWGDLAVLGGVVKFPMRVKCATLAWHAAKKGLESETDAG